MSNAFPTKKRQAKNSLRLSLWLTVCGIVLWIIFYAYGMLVIYGLVCPFILGCAVWNGAYGLSNERTVGGWLVLGGAVVCFVVSVIPWVLPVAR